MIAQAHSASCFKSLARYLESPKSHRPDLCRVAWIENRNLVCTGSLQDIAWEMTVVARASERVQKPVYHVSVSWAPEDDPEPPQMISVADEILRNLSMKENQAVYVAHGDEAYRHLHIMANRVHPKTRTACCVFKSYYTIERTLRHAEMRHGFRVVPGRLYRHPDLSPPERSQSLSKGAYKILSRDKTVPFQILVQRTAARDFTDACSWHDLKMRLARHGLSMVPQRSGLLVTDGSEYAKSSSIAPGISLRKLEKRFGETFSLRPRAPTIQRQQDRDMGWER